jgi:hypothetical protein
MQVRRLAEFFQMHCRARYGTNLQASQSDPTDPYIRLGFDMLMKHCTRCYFAVRQKRSICEICGNNIFASTEVQILPPEPRAQQITKTVIQFWHDVKAEFRGAVEGEQAQDNHH